MKIYLIICLVYGLLNIWANLYTCKKENKDFNGFILFCSVLGGVILPITLVTYFYDLVSRKIKEVRRRKAIIDETLAAANEIHKKYSDTESE